MSDDYTPAIGDWVKVSFEGAITDIIGDSLKIESADIQAGVIWTDRLRETLTVEKSELPVTTYEPGSVLRHKREDFVVALGVERYMYLSGIRAGTGYSYGSGFSEGYFTSKNFELVSVG